MQGNDQCLFCRIVAGTIPAKKLFEDDDVIAFEDINPQAPTHLLVIPRRHIASLDALRLEDSETIGRLLIRASEIARSRDIASDGYRLVFNNGQAAGQTVFHIHAHLLGGRDFAWPPG